MPPQPRSSTSLMVSILESQSNSISHQKNVLLASNPLSSGQGPLPFVAWKNTTPFRRNTSMASRNRRTSTLGSESWEVRQYFTISTSIQSPDHTALRSKKNPMPKLKRAKNSCKLRRLKPGHDENTDIRGEARTGLFFDGFNSVPTCGYPGIRARLARKTALRARHWRMGPGRPPEPKRRSAILPENSGS